MQIFLLFQDNLRHFVHNKEHSSNSVLIYNVSVYKCIAYILIYSEV